MIPSPLASKTATGKPHVARSEDTARANEVGRGRQARSPIEIPYLGWKDILIRKYRQFNEDRGMTIATGVAFYVLLAIIPTIGVFVSLNALFGDTSSRIC
jgi:membrane protein